MAQPAASQRRTTTSSYHSRDVGLIEIVAFEEKRHAPGAGESIGKAIPNIELCGMSPLPKTPPGVNCEQNLVGRKRFDCDAGYFDEL